MTYNEEMTMIACILWGILGILIYNLVLQGII